MNKKIVALGVLLVIISLIVAAMQDLRIYNIYGNVSNKWYFYGVIGVMLVVGIILAIWGLMKKPKK